MDFALFLQWLADRQLAAAAAAADGMTIGLYRDLAVGAAPDGTEAWAAGPLLMHGVSVGAPPDPLGPQGQNWGLPAPDPRRLRASGYAPFVELLRANMRHAGALRIDHVMGLARLFLVPDGGRAEDGTYLAYPLRDLLGQVALESVRARCLVVGEDLGTVPDGIRAALAEHDVLSYQVLRFARDGTGCARPHAIRSTRSPARPPTTSPPWPAGGKAPTSASGPRSACWTPRPKRRSGVPGRPKRRNCSLC